MSTPVAIVTGGAGGIGLAVCDQLRQSGYTTYSFDLNADPADAWSVTLDVTDSKAVNEAVSKVLADHDRVDVLVTAAGTFVEMPATDITPEIWNRTLGVHLGGTANLIRAVLPAMLAADFGRIVAITSDLALTGAPAAADYAAAKGAIVGLIRSLALETARTGVRANMVAPGPTDTPMIAPDEHYREESYLSTLPARRLVAPAEIARAVRLLVDDGDYYVGQIVSPNAGIAL